MSRSQYTADHHLVNAVLSGEEQARERFVRRVADTIWTSCSLLTREETAAREAFTEVLEALAADGCRRLRPYDGSSRIETFVALVAREVLAERLMRMFLLDHPDNAWRAFEAFFKADIERIIRKRIPGTDKEEARRDAYQETSMGLIADGYRRIRAYGGKGSFTGFIMQAVDRLVIDALRHDLARRRLPAAVARMAELDQMVFRLVHWESGPTDGHQLATDVERRTGDKPTAAEVEQALHRVAAALPASFDGSQSEVLPLEGIEDHPSGDRSPEDAILDREEEEILAGATRALRLVAETLSPAEMLYVRVALSSGSALPAREIAKLMKRPVEEVYKIKRRVMSRLRETLDDDSAVKTWRASV